MELLTIDDYIQKGLTHEIHNSERKSFNSCRRRWDWIYRGRYYPRTTAKPLEFGTAYHIGMEVYYSPQTWHFPNDVKVGLAKTAFANECERQKKEALAHGAYFDHEVEEDYNQRVELGLGMIEYYFSKISPEEDRNLTPAKVEIEFCVKIPHPDTGEVIWCKCNECWQKYDRYMDNQAASKSMALQLGEPKDGMTYNVTMQPIHPTRTWNGLPVVYSGRIDMLAYDEHGNLWIVDWKTAAAISEDKEWLDLDDQIGSYVWALRSINIAVAGFIYHEQLKGFPQRPKENQKRRNGAKFSVNKLADTDYTTALAVFAKEDTDIWGAGVYDDYLNFLKNEGKKYHDRKVVYKSAAQNKSVEVSIGEQALDMIDNPRTYYNSSKWNCNKCPFLLPCMEKNSGGDYEYALSTMYDKKKHYYEIIRDRERTTEK